MTVSVVMEAKDLQRDTKRKPLDIYSLGKDKKSPSAVQLRIVYLWYKVQESISWEGANCQTNKQLKDEGVGFLTGVKEDQADSQHGAHCDEQHSSRAVAILCRKESGLWAFHVQI